MNPTRIIIKVIIDGIKYQFQTNYNSIVSVDSVPIKELIKDEPTPTVRKENHVIKKITKKTGQTKIISM